MRTPENQCLEKAITMLSKSSYSKRRLSEKLSAAYDPIVAEKCILELERLGYLREREECLIWLNHFMMNRKSKKEIYFSLLKRGYEKELISELLDSISNEKEIENAIRVLKSMRKPDNNQEKYNEKVYAKLLRKGYSAETIRMAIKTLNSCEIESDFDENTDSLS